MLLETSSSLLLLLPRAVTELLVQISSRHNRTLRVLFTPGVHFSVHRTQQCNLLPTAHRRRSHFWVSQNHLSCKPSRTKNICMARHNTSFVGHKEFCCTFLCCSLNAPQTKPDLRISVDTTHYRCVPSFLFWNLPCRFQAPTDRPMAMTQSTSSPQTHLNSATVLHFRVPNCTF